MYRIGRCAMGAPQSPSVLATARSGRRYLHHSPLQLTAAETASFCVNYWRQAFICHHWYPERG